MNADQTGSGKQQLADKYGAIAIRLYDVVASIDPSMGNYLIASLLGGPLPANTDLRRRQAMRIAALATQGNRGDDLAVEINRGLDTGLTPSEIVETIIHTIPYAGIPKPLNSLLAAKEVLRQRDLLPVELDEPDWSLEERRQVGERQIAHAHPAASPVLQANLAEIAPSVYDYIVGVAFADVYGRPGLAYVQRQPITIAALATLGDVQNHLTTHVNGALNIGIDPLTIINALIDTLPLNEPERILESIETATAVFAERNVSLTVDSPLTW